jgi:ribosomal protein L37AE/L43A
MKEITDLQWIPRETYYAVWICPLCGKENKRYEETFAERWMCRHCGKLSRKKPPTEKNATPKEEEKKAVDLAKEGKL